MIEQLTAMWEAGFRVFPLYEIEDGKCTCGDPDCFAAGKHPLTSGWPSTPEWSEDQMENMIEYRQFTTGYGVVCKGLIVIDIDPRNGGSESYARLVEDCPEVAGAGMIVETGRRDGGKHLYFKAPEGVALLQHLKQYKGIDFRNGATFVVGAGSLHEVGQEYRVVYGSPDEIEEAPQSLIEMLKKPERHRTEYAGSTVDVSFAEVAEMVSYCDPDAGREEWLSIGMAIHHALDGEGFDIWDDWSSRGATYPDTDSLKKQWDHFGKSTNPVTLGTLIYHAEQGGWVMPVTFVSDQPPIAPEVKSDLPCDVVGIDIRRPHGFVGVVTDWINSQCRRPRETIAVAAALAAIGNITGLRYTDSRDGVTGNLFSFCVAASRTGKEAVQQAQAELHRVAGIHLATHGSFKSEQEVTRNLVRHQAAFYIVDEIGIILKKIKNAQIRGGAAYLEGLIGQLMAAYSKADSFMLLTGDMKEEVRQIILKELSRAENNGDDTEPYMQALARIDNGLEKPFVSMIGYTTPETFLETMDFDNATNGFIGRSLLFIEKKNVPRAKKGFKKDPLPMGIRNRLISLYDGGHFDPNNDRIGYYGDRVKIPVTDKANALLDDILDWLEDTAEAQEEGSGLESLYLGAYELVAKVAFIMGVGQGIIDYEDVRFAFALVKETTETKLRAVVANDRQKDAPEVALAAGLMNKIGHEWVTQGVLVNKTRGRKPEDVINTLNKMVDNGMLERVETKHPRNGRVAIKYRRNK